MLRPNVVLATMLVAESAEVLRNHYKEAINTYNKSTSRYLPEAWERASAVGMDVGQDSI